MLPPFKLLQIENLRYTRSSTLRYAIASDFVRARQRARGESSRAPLERARSIPLAPLEIPHCCIRLGGQVQQSSKELITLTHEQSGIV